MTEEQLHAGVVAELLWRSEGWQLGRLPHPRFASPTPTGMFAITLDIDHQSCDA
jgi:hypothetical protein